MTAPMAVGSLVLSTSLRVVWSMGDEPCLEVTMMAVWSISLAAGNMQITIVKNYVRQCLGCILLQGQGKVGIV